MCQPIHSLDIPHGLDYSCDAVASFYLHDKEHANEKLFKEPDGKYFQNRQNMIEWLKDSILSGVADKKTLDMWLWGKLVPKEIFVDHHLNSLTTDLTSLGMGGPWSLQVLPDSFHQAGHHMALGRSPNNINWWLLDPASKMYVFASLSDLAKFALRLLQTKFGLTSRTVLLEVS